MCQRLPLNDTHLSSRLQFVATALSLLVPSAHRRRANHLTHRNPYYLLTYRNTDNSDLCYLIAYLTSSITLIVYSWTISYLTAANGQAPILYDPVKLKPAAGYSSPAAHDPNLAPAVGRWMLVTTTSCLRPEPMRRWRGGHADQTLDKTVAAESRLHTVHSRLLVPVDSLPIPTRTVLEFPAGFHILRRSDLCYTLSAAHVLLVFMERGMRQRGGEREQMSVCIHGTLGSLVSLFGHSDRWVSRSHSGKVNS